MASWSSHNATEGWNPAPLARHAATPDKGPPLVYNLENHQFEPLLSTAPVQPKVAAIPQPSTRPVLQDAGHRVNKAPAHPPATVGKDTKPYAILMGSGDERMNEVPRAPPVPPAPAVPPFGAFDAMLATSNLIASPSANNSTSTKKTATASKKRKAEASTTSLEEDIATYKQDLSHIETEGMVIDMNCNQVRKLINKVLDCGIFKKGEFCNTIHSSNNAVNRFLAQSGPDQGMYSEAYANAWDWFKQREIAGLKMPDVKKRQAAAAAAAAKAAGGAAPAAKRTKTGAAAAAAAATTRPDLDSITLPGESTDSVPVFDSADEIRKKINAHLKTPGLTQAQFCRDLYAQLKAPNCKAIQTKQLTDFRAKKGPLAGVRSSVFYTAYVYFEKLRLASGGSKSKHRLAMEKAHPSGLDLTHDGSSGFWCMEGETVTLDSCGVIHVSRRY